MGLALLMFLAVALMFAALWSKNFLVAVIDAAAWFAALSSALTTPPAGIVAGSNTHQFLVIALGVAGIGIIITVVTINWKNNKSIPMADWPTSTGQKTAHFITTGTRSPRVNPNHRETGEEYAARLEGESGKKPKRK